MCDKVAYETKAEARQVIKGMAHGKSSSMDFYWCDQCDYWHITTRKPRQKNVWLGKNKKYPFRYIQINKR